MGGPERLPSRPSSHVLLPEGQAATEAVSTNARVPPARCFLLPPRTCSLRRRLCGLCRPARAEPSRPIRAEPAGRRGPGCRSSAPEAGGRQGRGSGAGHVPETGVLGGRRGSSIPS